METTTFVSFRSLKEREFLPSPWDTTLLFSTLIWGMRPVKGLNFSVCLYWHPLEDWKRYHQNIYESSGASIAALTRTPMIIHLPSNPLWQGTVITLWVSRYWCQFKLCVHQSSRCLDVSLALVHSAMPSGKGLRIMTGSMCHGIIRTSLGGYNFSFIQ